MSSRPTIVITFGKASSIKAMLNDVRGGLSVMNVKVQRISNNALMNHYESVMFYSTGPR